MRVQILVTADIDVGSYIENRVDRIANWRNTYVRPCDALQAEVLSHLDSITRDYGIDAYTVVGIPQIQE